MPRPPRVELVCEVCGKTVLLPPSMIAQGRRRCSAKCMAEAYRKPTIYTCVGCGKMMTTAPSVATKRKYCSVECRRINEKARINCEVCGAERRVTPSQLKQGARFCSWECARKALNAPRPVVVCEQCGRECSVPPSRVRQGMRFCSHSCRSIYNITHGAMASPTSIEVILYQTLDLLNISYIRQHSIPEAGTVPDAYVPDGRVLLYADGAYWHALPRTAARDQRQNQELTRLGYSVRRLTEADLRQNPVETVRRALGM